MSNFIKTTLNNKLIIKHWFAFLWEYFSTNWDYILLTPWNFEEAWGFKFDSKKAKFYSWDFPESYITKKWDLVVAMTEQAPWLLWSTALVPIDDKFLHNQRIWFIEVNKEQLDKLFTYYLFNTKNVRRQIQLSSTGTKVKHTSPNRIYDVEVFIPLDVIYQQKIGSALSIIDSKIKLNNKINAELEQMAKTIYDYWFVQFDFPDENWKPYRSSGWKMVWSKELKREIPKKWNTWSLLDIATFTNGLACQKFRPENNNEYYRVIKIKEMWEGFTEKSEFVSKSIPEKVVIRNGDVLFSWSATLDVKIWAGWIWWLNQHIFKITSDKYPKSYYYFELLRYLEHFKMIAELRKTTMGHITQDHLKQSRIAIPDNDSINKLDGIINPIIEKIVKNKEENQQLIKLCDWLLPMLMNGQVKIS